MNERNVVFHQANQGLSEQRKSNSFISSLFSPQANKGLPEEQRGEQFNLMKDHLFQTDTAFRLTDAAFRLNEP